MSAELRELLDAESPVRASLPDQAYAAIRQAIVDVTLRPGEPVSEVALARWLGMSRTPVREAITRLRHERLMYSVPRRGLFVSPISLSDLREAYEMLEGLDAIIARLVVERASDADVVRLGQLVTSMESAIDADERQEWRAADRAFHALLAELSGNQLVHEARDGLRDRLGRVSKIILPIRPQPSASTAEHRALYDAIVRRDRDAAIAIAHAHRARARDEVIGLLRERAADLVTA